jgi:hypothetical protein
LEEFVFHQNLRSPALLDPLQLNSAAVDLLLSVLVLNTAFCRRETHSVTAAELQSFRASVVVGESYSIFHLMALRRAGSSISSDTPFASFTTLICMIATAVHGILILRLKYLVSFHCLAVF